MIEVGIMERKRPQVDADRAASRWGSQPGASLHEIEAWIRRYNSDLDAGSETYRAAVVLAAGINFGHNIDQLARRTGYGRAFVARVVRRLIDNGVWQSGGTFVDWSIEDEASGTFWNDVAVAEGKMCRRVGPGGQIEWAPAGFWNKSFQFVDPEADRRLANLYLDPNRSETGAPVDAGNAASALADDSSTLPEQIGDAAADPYATQVVGPLPAADTGSEPPRSKPGSVAAVPTLDELFGSVVWIG